MYQINHLLATNCSLLVHLLTNIVELILTIISSCTCTIINDNAIGLFPFVLTGLIF